MTEDEMVGWLHRLNAHDFEQAPGDSDGQESLACRSPWGCKESDTTERWTNNNTTRKCHVGWGWADHFTLWAAGTTLMRLPWESAARSPACQALSVQNTAS